MKNSLVQFVMVTRLVAGFCTTTSAWGTRHTWRHVPYRVARGYVEPVVVIDRPVVSYVHGRCYHPTPYCNEPVVFRREYYSTPWYYNAPRPEYHDHALVYHDRYCHGGHCYRR